MRNRRHYFVALAAPICLLLSSLAAQSPPAAGEVELQLDPSQTDAAITLSTTFHTVEGKFLLKRGMIRYDPATGKTSGEIVFDATSGNTDNASRDHKMHKEVLESQRYPEIVFRPDRAEGTFSLSGTSSLKVHGKFGIHGAEHEVRIPVEVTFSGDRWNANATFQVPYRQWGMRNPSVMFLRVADTVQVKFRSGGKFNP